MTAQQHAAEFGPVTEAPERIWAWTEHDECGWHKFWISNLERVDGSETEYIRADLTRAQVAAVKVKPLVWEDFDGGHGVKANAMLLVSYLIVKRRDGIFEVTVSCPGYQTWFDGKPRHDTLEAAKAAAQADYARRILSALDAPVDANALVAAAYEAAAQVAQDCMDELDEYGNEYERGQFYTARAIRDGTRELIPDDAKAALDDLLKAERAKAYERAAVEISDYQAFTKYAQEPLTNEMCAAIRALAQEDGE